jgi:pimeloyl-ACP methyl ester carboxylesterase
MRRRPPPTPATVWPAGVEGLTSRLVTLASGLRARVVEAGPIDAPAVVLVHGWACTAFSWRRQVPVLAAAGRRVVACDIKGHGFSDKPPLAAEYSASAMTSFVMDVMDACDVPRAALVGHSMGGAIAASVALAAPERVDRLVLVAPVGFGEVLGLRLGRWLSPDRALPLLPRLGKVAMAAPRWTLATSFRLIWGGGPVTLSPDDVEEYRAPTQFADYVPALRHLVHAFEWLPHAEEQLARLACPVLVLFGTRDRVVTPRKARELVELVPHGRLELVPGAGHMVQEECAAAVNALLLEFLAEGDRARLS